MEIETAQLLSDYQRRLRAGEAISAEDVNKVLHIIRKARSAADTGKPAKPKPPKVDVEALLSGLDNPKGKS